MTLPVVRQDREQQKFKEVNNQVAVRVCNIQASGEQLATSPYPSGSVVKNIFNEVTSIASGLPTDVISYTVPVGKSFQLKAITAQGNNLAKFKVIIDNTDQEIQRSWWTKFNVNFQITDIKLIAGQILKVEVLHNSSSTGDFSANIIGAEF